jgi:hypothetical protein
VSHGNFRSGIYIFIVLSLLRLSAPTTFAFANDTPPLITGPLSPNGLKLHLRALDVAKSSEFGPETQALEINDVLRQSYEDLTDAKQPGDAEAATKTLVVMLRALHTLDDTIKSWPGTPDDQVQDGARRARMVAWLHAWGVLGRLVTGLNDALLASKRAELLGLDDKGALGMLLLIYKAI